MKIVKKIKVKNALGLHIRPAAAIAKMLQLQESSVMFSYKDGKVNARSVMSILSLAVKKNATIEITVEGKDASKTMELLLQGFNERFGEE